MVDFYPRPPRGGRHGKLVTSSTFEAISIHALREEGDTNNALDEAPVWEFLSTPSARRATNDQLGHIQMLAISIHALREEGDTATKSRPATTKYFYPRPPRGGRPAHADLFTGGGKISIHALREEGDTVMSA